MGTLIKEDFGRPDRANTMVNTELWTQLVFYACGYQTLT